MNNGHRRRSVGGGLGDPLRSLLQSLRGQSPRSKRYGKARWRLLIGLATVSGRR